MIKNDKQKAITKQRLEEFKEALISIEKRTDVHPLQQKFEISGIKSQIEEFENDIKEYEQLKNNDVHFLEVNSLESFQEALIKSRIIKGWTQADLARAVDLDEQQIQRYESCNYATATIKRLSLVADALEMDIQPFKIEFQKKYEFSPGIDKNKLEKLRERVSNNQCLLELNN